MQPQSGGMPHLDNHGLQDGDRSRLQGGEQAQRQVQAPQQALLAAVALEGPQRAHLCNCSVSTCTVKSGQLGYHQRTKQAPAAQMLQWSSLRSSCRGQPHAQW